MTSLEPPAIAVLKYLEDGDGWPALHLAKVRGWVVGGCQTRAAA